MDRLAVGLVARLGLELPQRVEQHHQHQREDEGREDDHHVEQLVDLRRRRRGLLAVPVNGSITAEIAAASASVAASIFAIGRRPIIGGGTVRIRQTVKVAPRGGDHATGDTLPAPEPPSRSDKRLASLCPGRLGKPKPPAEPLCDGLDRPLLDRERGTTPTSGGSAAASWCENLPHPRVVRRDRKRPTAASAATIPNASGNVLGITSASASGQQLGHLIVLQPPDEFDRPCGSPGSFRIAYRRVRKERRQDRQHLLLPALQPPPESRDLADIVQIPAIESRKQPTQPVLVLPEARNLQSRLRMLGLNQGPCRQQEINALGDDQLANEDNERPRVGTVPPRVAWGEGGRGRTVDRPQAPLPPHDRTRGRRAPA